MSENRRDSAVESADVNRYPPREERLSSIIHGLGILLSALGLLVMLVQAHRYGGGFRHYVGALVFGCGLLLTYISSTFYHAFSKPDLKRLFRLFDHLSIFILIAATYTPLTLINLRGPWGWGLFGTVWGLALVGIAVECTRLKRFRFISIALYLGMGWAVVGAGHLLVARVEPGGVRLLVAGGLFYTIGVIFYIWRKLPFNHAIWHLFVLAGSISHFLAVTFYVLPVH